MKKKVRHNIKKTFTSSIALSLGDDSNIFKNKHYQVAHCEEKKTYKDKYQSEYKEMIIERKYKFISYNKRN